MAIIQWTLHCMPVSARVVNAMWQHNFCFEWVDWRIRWPGWHPLTIPKWRFTSMEADRFDAAIDRSITEHLIQFTEENLTTCIYVYYYVIISLECRNWAFRKVGPFEWHRRSANYAFDIDNWERPGLTGVCVCACALRLSRWPYFYRYILFFWLSWCLPACLHTIKYLWMGKHCGSAVLFVRDYIMDADWWWHLVLFHIAEWEWYLWYATHIFIFIRNLFFFCLVCSFPNRNKDQSFILLFFIL